MLQILVFFGGRMGGTMGYLWVAIGFGNKKPSSLGEDGDGGRGNWDYY
jgi:hypothetical protein